MTPRALISLCVAAVAGLALAACGGGGDGDDEQRAQTYELRVERISDDAYETAQDSLVTLNRLADGSVRARPAIARLDRGSERIGSDREQLDRLAPPEAATQVADDLAFQLDSLSRSLGEAAATATADTRGGGSLEDTGRTFARVVLAYQSGTAALSRALRTLVSVDADD